MSRRGKSAVTRSYERTAPGVPKPPPTPGFLESERASLPPRPQANRAPIGCRKKEEFPFLTPRVLALAFYR